MKKVLLGLFFIFIAAKGFSQTTINETDVFSVGDINYTATDSISKDLDVSKTGINQIWNYSALNVYRYDTVRYVAPSSTPYASTFPTANLATADTVSGTYTYFLKNSSGISMLGTSVQSPFDSSRFNIKQTPAKNLIKFPLTYLSTYKDSSSNSLTFDGSSFGVDSVRTKNKIVSNSICDGYGRVITPAGNFYNSLRVKTTNVTKATIEVYIKVGPAGFWQTFQNTIDTTVDYTWYEKTQKFSIITINFTHDSTGVYLTSTSYNADSSIHTGIKEFTKANNLQAYPNPSAALINVPNKNGKIDIIEVYDILGNKVQAFKLSREQVFTFGTELLNNGLYFLKAIDAHGNIIGTEKVSVLK